MALDNFFTSTDLKYGLTSPEKVNDLITAIQKDQDSGIVNSFNEATRQWSTVAQTIAATEDHNCLNLFLDLNGLSFIDKWLNNAQNLKDDTDNNKCFEGLIIELLKALERLQIDTQKSLDSGIGKTVKNLVVHESCLIREKAKMVSDKWMLNDAVPQNVETIEEIPTSDILLDKVPTNQEPTCGDTNLSEKTELVEMSSLSSPLEQIASSADVDNVPEPSTKTDVIGDKDEDMVDNDDDDDDFQIGSQKTSSSSESERETENEEKGSSLIKSSMNKTSELELDYGMIDPLEVARQVANEVEQEADDSRELSCSTSESPKTPESMIPELTPESTIPELTPPVPMKESETLVSKPDVTASQVSEVAQESEPNTGKGVGGFDLDLNQEVCSEEVDNITPVSISSTVSIVSASRATAAAELPITPLQFEGSLGWKGSASTSAFRRVPEIEKSGSHNSSKKRLDCLDFDLNAGADVPSGEESSVDAGPTRPQLDLNSIGDEGADVARSDWWQSPSRSSSSSSKQPSRNIDLNLMDQPQESVISIFGTKVEVKNKSFQNLPQQPSRRITNSTTDFNTAKTHYNNNQPFYGHNNGYPSGPTMFFYGPTGPIPYMVDSRAQFMGGSSSSQPPLPFMVNMAAASGSSGLTGGAPPGPTLHNFDLNTGLSIGGKRREPDGRWDFFPVNKHQQPPWR